MKKLYRAAIIGCGRVAWLLEDDPMEAKPCTHMGAYRELEKQGRVKVVAAADTDRKRLKAFGDKYGLEELYIDYREMLYEQRPELVSVCAWATERFSMVMDSIEAGVKGIWCEKAFATSLDEARRMKREAERNGVSIIVSHLRRWSGEYAKAKEIITDGSIGEVRSCVCHFSGSLIHTGTHAFDVLNWFFGPAEWVEGFIEETSVRSQSWELSEDPGGHAVIQFKNGVYSTVSADTRPYFFFEFDITGTGGRLRIGNNGVLELMKPGKSLYYNGIKELFKVPFPQFEQKNIWTEALGNLIDCVEGKAENQNGPQAGEDALEMALAIHQSSRSGGKRTYLPLKKNRLSVRSR